MILSEQELIATTADVEPETPWLTAPLRALKGRGAITNITGRFETQEIEVIDDGWWHTDEEHPSQSIKTLVSEETARTILSHNSSPDLPFSVSLNPYRGCEHGCIYCFARASHAYLGLSPGLDFETRLYAKTNAAELLRHALAKPKYQVSPIALGVNTDAYQPCDRKLQITREVLRVLHECNHPVGLITKSSLIERDIDLLAPMADKNLAVAAISLTTLDHNLARSLEPRAASPTRRLATIRRLAAAGIPVSVSIAPIIPFITDQTLEQLLTAAAEAGATRANYTMLCLPWEVNPLFQQWLEVHFPERAGRVMNAIRELRGGKDYRADFSTRMHGEGPWAELFKQRFSQMVKRLGLQSHSHFGQLDVSQFQAPSNLSRKTRKLGGDQLDFFNL